ncbi:MAG: murein biosynthesis integral membrane protein MurJ [Clostridia bacterium]
MNILGAAFLVTILNFVSRILGFVRDAVIANRFGATGVTDAYMIAYNLPYALEAVLGMALASVVIPIVMGYVLQNNKRRAWELVTTMLQIVFVSLTAVTLLSVIFAPQLVHLMAPSFSGETLALTVKLTRIIFPSLIFMSIGMLLTGVLNANKHFILPAFAPALTNIIIIGAVICFGASFKMNGLAFATLIGYVGFLAVQLFGLKNIGFKFYSKIRWNDPEIIGIIVAVFPMSLTIAVNQILLMINRMFASGLAEGSITSLDYANRVMQLPMGIFVASIVTILFPSFAEFVKKQDWLKFADILSQGLGVVTLLILPISAGFMILSVPLIGALYERGAFSSLQTLATASAFMYFSLGLWAIAVNMIITRAFYAMQNLKTPVILGFVYIIISVCLSFILIPLMGSSGLALANTIAAYINMLQLFIILLQKVPGLSVRKFLPTVFKVLLAVTIMSAAIIPLTFYLEKLLGSATLQRLITIVIVGIVGLLVYGIIIYLLKVEEIKWFLNIFKQRKSKNV